MDFFSTRLIDDNVCEEGNELSRGVARRRFAQDLTGLGVERRVERERAMPEILKTVAFRPPWRKRQHRIEPIQGLDRGFLIDAKYGRVLRWMQIQADDVGGLLLEVRIIRSSCNRRVAAA